MLFFYQYYWTISLHPSSQKFDYWHYRFTQNIKTMNEQIESSQDKEETLKAASGHIGVWSSSFTSLEGKNIRTVCDVTANQLFLGQNKRLFFFF